jgi:hypothetical protein
VLIANGFSNFRSFSLAQSGYWQALSARFRSSKTLLEKKLEKPI